MGYQFTTEGGGKGLTPEPQSAEIVRRIFDMRLHGCSTIKIVDTLNRERIPPAGNHYFDLGLTTHPKYEKRTLWQNSYICNLLRNEVYTGDLLQGKYERKGKRAAEKPRNEWIVHKNAHPAIVDRTVFDAVQALLAEAQEKYSKKGNTLDENIFVGKVFCSRCGRAAKRGYYRKNKNEVRYNYFCLCCDNELRPTYTPGTIRRTPLDAVEKAVLSAVSLRMELCIDIDEMLDDITASPAIDSRRKALLSEQRRVESANKKAEDMLSAAFTHHLAGLLDANEFELARAKFERDKLNAAAELARIESAMNELDVGEIRKNRCLSHFCGFKGFTKLDKAIVSALVERIEITPATSDVTVTLAFRDEFETLNALAKESGVLTNAC